ncbi:MAG: DUF6496 domain-containing protein [Vulcanimicrobiaceae bacterium]
MKQGKLRSGRSGKRVSNPKQAVAIGLSEARREGDKVPPNPNDSGPREYSQPARSTNVGAASFQRQCRAFSMCTPPM